MIESGGNFIVCLHEQNVGRDVGECMVDGKCHTTCSIFFHEFLGEVLCFQLQFLSTLHIFSYFTGGNHNIGL